MKGLYSSKTDEWPTPQWLFDELNEEFHFTLDPCATDENHKCERYFTKADDGLKNEWGGSVLQSSIRETDRTVGEESIGSKNYSSHALAGENRHEMVSRVYLRQSGDTVHQRQTEVWRFKPKRAVSVNDSSV